MSNLKILTLLETFRLIERKVSLVLFDTGFTLSQFRLLHRIALHMPTSASKLSLELGIAKPSVTAQLRELEKAELVTINSNPEDQRSFFISLSANGNVRFQIACKNIALLEKKSGEKLFSELETMVNQIEKSITK